jgi:predicted ABC-type ATPase
MRRQKNWDKLRGTRHANVPDQIPCIYVLAGTNGAGMSSVAGAMFLARGTGYFNPDAVASRIRSANPGLTAAEANSEAWRQGKRLLQRAITERLNFAFETTLSGNTIPALLSSALSAGIEVRVWYVGLRSVNLHIARVRARVEKGGHAIPEEKIRERYDRSRHNLIRLLPRLTELRVYDNSGEADPHAGASPEPKLLLHVASRKIVSSCKLHMTPEWAKPIFAAAIKSFDLPKR